MSAPVPPLIEPGALKAQLADLVVLDIREAAAFAAGHIPGAVSSPYAADGWRVAKAGAGMLPDEDALAAMFARLGLRPQDHVVIVSAGEAVNDFSGAARVFWTLRVAGHRRLSILSGGLRAWAVSGGPVETGMPTPRPASTYPVRIDGSLRATADDVARAVDTGDAVLVDGRSLAFFEGREKSSQAQRAGRLPGAVHVDHSQAFDTATGLPKPAAELRALFAEVGDEPVVSYCNTGHLASANWFILSEILGRPDVTLYDGSMSEWTADPERPVETG